MVLLTLPTSIPEGRRKAAFCCDEAHAPSSNVSVSSSVVVFILLPRLWLMQSGICENCCAYDNDGNPEEASAIFLERFLR
jgi:hypothetical protein